MDKKIKNIWVINDEGDLILGEDIKNNDGIQGHPTLVDGKPSRLGGELYFNNEKNEWYVNLRSKTYSGHLKIQSALWREYLTNVINNLIKGAKIEEE